MNLHSNAALTISQRRQVKGLFDSGGYTQRQLARRFNVSATTIGYDHRSLGQTKFAFGS